MTADEIIRTVKFCVDTRSLTRDQTDLFERHAGTYRAVWNWALAERNKHYLAVQRDVHAAATAQVGEDREAIKTLLADDAWRKAAYAAAKEANPTPYSHNANGFDLEFTRLATTDEAYGARRDGTPMSFGWWSAGLRGPDKHGVSRKAVSEPLRNLDRAVADFYSGKSKRGNRKRKDHMPSGWPTFKSKRDPGQFALYDISPKGNRSKILDDTTGSSRRLRVPNLGSIRVHDSTRRLRTYIRKGGVPNSVRFTQVADRWYVSIVVAFEADNLYVRPRPTSRTQKRNGAVGMDAGVVLLAALSTGETQGSLQPARDAQDHKATSQRALARTQKGSRRSIALRRQIARLDHLVSLRRATVQHHLTKDLTTRFATIVVEDLSLSRMTKSVAPKPDPDHPGHFLKNGKRSKAGLNRSLLDAGLAEIQRQLGYKSLRYGSAVVSVNPAYTSLTCSQCGHVGTREKNRKSQAVYSCDVCGHTANADVNAAINILNKHLGQHGCAEQDGTGILRGINDRHAMKRKGLTKTLVSQSGPSDRPALLNTA